jgi:hypothetical protein
MHKHPPYDCQRMGEKSLHRLNNDAYEALIGLARVCYWLAQNAAERASKSAEQQGMDPATYREWVEDWSYGLGAATFIKQHARRILRVAGRDIVRWHGFVDESELLVFLNEIQQHLVAAEHAAEQ